MTPKELQKWLGLMTKYVLLMENVKMLAAHNKCLQCENKYKPRKGIVLKPNFRERESYKKWYKSTKG